MFDRNPARTAAAGASKQEVECSLKQADLQAAAEGFHAGSLPSTRPQLAAGISTHVLTADEVQSHGSATANGRGGDGEGGGVASGGDDESEDGRAAPSPRYVCMGPGRTD
jgi:hypothetical protein